MLPVNKSQNINVETSICLEIIIFFYQIETKYNCDLELAIYVRLFLYNVYNNVHCVCLHTIQEMQT